MDPDMNLAEQRSIIADLRIIEESEDGVFKLRGPEYVAKATRLVELVTAMDEWLANGGFVPKAWALCAAPIDAKEMF